MLHTVFSGIIDKCPTLEYSIGNTVLCFDRKGVWK